MAGALLCYVLQRNMPVFGGDFFEDLAAMAVVGTLFAAAYALVALPLVGKAK